MNEPHQSGQLNAFSLLDDRGFENEIAQIRTKALLTEISGSASAARWTYSAARVVRNAVAVMVELQGPDLGASDPEVRKKIARRVAQLWESLARLEEKTSRRLALTNAAIAYEIAGYQANASCLAGLPRHPLNRWVTRLWRT